MEELEVKFKCFIKDSYVTGWEKEYKFLTDYKNNIKKYFNEYEKVAKTKFGNSTLKNNCELTLTLLSIELQEKAITEITAKIAE